MNKKEITFDNILTWSEVYSKVHKIPRINHHDKACIPTEIKKKLYLKIMLPALKKYNQELKKYLSKYGKNIYYAKKFRGLKT